jgi:competence protein ComEC
MLQTGTLAFLGGILLLQSCSVLPCAWWFYALPLGLAGLFLTRRCLVVTACLSLGFLWALFQAQALLTQRLPPQLSHHNLQVRGYVASLPERRGNHTRFVFEIDEFISPQLKHYPHKVRLSWYHNPPELQPGDEWLLTLRLHAPHNFTNPGSFDYSGWLLQKGIIATGYVYAKGRNSNVARQTGHYLLQQLRYRLRNYLDTVLADAPAGGLLKALVMGDRSGIAEADWKSLQHTGTVHLMAISGLHIGLVAGFVYFIILSFWRVLPRACLVLPAPKAAAIAGWLAALMYSALAGFAIPTQRALLMLAVLVVAQLLHRQHKPSQVLATALLLILIWDPFAVLSASFWLSFCAVGLIYYLLQIKPLRVGRVQQWWRLQLAISLGLLPIGIMFFQQAPLISPLTNLFAIPWVSIVVLPLALVSVLLAPISTSMAAWGLQLASGLMHLLQLALAWIGAMHWHLVYLPAPTTSSLLLALTGIAVLLLPRGIPARYLGLILCLPLVLPLPLRPKFGEAVLSLLDVGQGLATVIQTTGHTLVFDTGPRFSAFFDTGEAVIVPFLRQQHVAQIDTLMVSHSDRDHIGGAQSLLSTMPVRQIISSVPGILRDRRDMICSAGLTWQWDGVRFRILYPSTNEFHDTTPDNNRSCVLQILTYSQRLLLTGDIEQDAEARLISRFGTGLRSNILIVPHHGSHTSSTAAFLDSVDPSLALIPVGWHNRFGLPAKSVVERYLAHQVSLLATASAGAIRVETDETPKVQSYRTAHLRYWHAW